MIPHTPQSRQDIIIPLHPSTPTPTRFNTILQTTRKASSRWLLHTLETHPELPVQPASKQVNVTTYPRQPQPLIARHTGASCSFEKNELNYNKRCKWRQKKNKNYTYIRPNKAINVIPNSLIAPIIITFMIYSRKRIYKKKKSLATRYFICI